MNDELIKLFNHRTLTESEIRACFENLQHTRPDGTYYTADELMLNFARAIEALHGIE
jgi:hypothetical protein